MTPLPLSRVGLHWQQHASALWWLGLAYRWPYHFVQHLQQLPRRNALVISALLWFHALPYVLLICFLARVVLFDFGLVDAVILPNDSTGFTFHSRDIIHGIVFGIVFGITGGIAFGRIAGFFGGIAFGIISGIFFEIAVGICGGIILGMAFKIAFGIAIGMFIGNYFKITYGTIGGIIGGTIIGKICGITINIISGTAFGIASGFAYGIAIGIAIGNAVKISASISIGMVGGIFVGMAFGIPAGMSFGVAFGIVALRAFYHIAHPFFIWPRLRSLWYPYHPIAWDNLCSLPFPGLWRLLAAYAEQNTDGEQEIERLSKDYPSQRMAARWARTHLIAHEAAQEKSLSQLNIIIAKLPLDGESFRDWILEVRVLVSEIVQLQRWLDTLGQPYQRERIAERLCKQIQEFHERASQFSPPLNEFRQAACKWLTLAKKQHSKAKTDLARGLMPQVFRTGYPVDQRLEAFVSRDMVLSELEYQATLSTACPGLILYGQRRTGKSTLLKNLYGFLPARIHIITVSMRPVRAFTSLESLLDLIMQAVRNVWSEPEKPVVKPVNLPLFLNFLNDCNHRLETKGERLLLALDEYDILDNKLGEGVFTEDLLKTLRESIQSHHQIIWVFAGRHALTELTHAPWSFYLTSARTLIMPLFTEEETRSVLTKPLKHSLLWDSNDPKRPCFDPAFWGDGGIESIHTEAGGWPHFVQLLAEITVNLCNASGQRHTDAALLEKAMSKAVEVDDVLLQELLLPEDASPEEWAYLRGFRTRDTQPPPDDEAVSQALRRRWLVEPVNGEWRLRAPLMQRWLRERNIDHQPRPRGAALRAEIKLIAREAAKEKRLSQLDTIVAKLPSDEGFQAWIPKIKVLVGEITQLQRQIDTLTRPYFKEPKAELLCAKIENFQHVMNDFPTPLREEFQQAARQWRILAEQQYRETQVVLAREPFLAGNAIDRTKNAFVQRDHVLSELAHQSNLSSGCPGLILYGRRRIGKSTLLYNLDGFLPTSVRTITLSMQDPDAFMSLASFLNLIAQRLQRVWPELKLPADEVTLKSFFQLLTTCNARLEDADQRLLLAIDEYENLDRKLGEGLFTEDLLVTVRESIQTHRRLTWIFAGNHTIDELPHAPWSSYLVSARTLEIEPFSAAETRLLLTEPLRDSPLWDSNDPERPHFDPQFWGPDGIERIHQETGGWPYLVQMLAETAVGLRNNRVQNQIDTTLLDEAIKKCIVSGDSALRELMNPNEATPAERAYLRGFRTRDTQPPPDDETVYQALRRRLLVELVNGQWRLRVPLMQRWLRERG